MAEVKCWAIGTGKVNPLFKASRQAANYISNLEGFVGIHIGPDGRNVWLFDTENHAKVARNMMRSKGIECGKHIGECFVDEKYLDTTD